MLHNKTNAELLKEFDKHVIGHTKAKKMLISLVNRSKTAHYQKHGRLQPDHSIETMNCMLIGGSGTGKTHLVNTLQKIVPFPLIRLDSQMLSPGDNSDGMGSTKIKKMIRANAVLLNKQQPLIYPSVAGTIDQTIIFIDEIDKIAGQLSSNSRQWNKQVQAALLTMIEDSGAFKQVSFILAGSFAGMEQKESLSGPIGFFHNNPQQKTQKNISADVVEFGLIPELVGRLASISVLDTLTHDVLSSILYKILLPQASYLFNEGLDTATPILPKKHATKMIKESLSSGQGVRYLKREVNSFFADLEFNFEVKRGV